MRANAKASPDDIDITSLWGALRRSLKSLVLWSVMAGALTYALLSLVAPRYDSEALLKVIAKDSANPFSDPKREGASAESLASRMDKEAVNTHVRSLLSPDLGAKIVADLKLAEKVEFNSALGSPDTLSRVMRLAGIGSPRAGESEQDRVLGAYFKRLEVYPAKESRVIGIKVSSSDPDLAADIANRLAEAYRTSLASQSIAETDDVQKALEPKIAKLSEEVSVAESEVERFRGEVDIFKGGQQATGLNEQQLQELTAELSKAKAARSEAEARTKSAKEMMKAGSADALPDVQKSPLIQNLIQQRVRVERQISELSATLLPGHPRMHQLNADLAGLKKQIIAEVAKIVDGLEKEAKVSAFREESITKSLDTLKARVVTTGPDEVKLRALEANAKSKRSELERLQAQFEANRARADDSRSVPVEAQVITRARAASVPTFPKKLPFALLVMAATLLFGLALTLTKAMLIGARSASSNILSPSDLAYAAHRGRESAAMALQAAPAQAVFAAPEPELDDRIVKIGTIGGLAGHLIAKTTGTSGLRTLIAGETETIDPAAEAIELAKTLAGKGGAVVLIEWAPDGGSIASGLGVTSFPGLSELLDDTASFEDVIRRIPLSQAHFIAQGASIEDVADVDAERINLILDALDEAYDHIIVAGRYEAARELFETIQGRFDAGVSVSDVKKRVSVISDPAGTFLGFEVADIELVSFERPASSASVGQRIVRGGEGPRPEQHPI